MSPEFYKRYMLGILMLILAFNNMDRVALGLLLQDIKVDLDLTDTQLGLLSGIAFALFYSVMGIPIARWADRGNRVALLSITTALWSAAMALSALARGFVQLLLIRVAVAVGEAGCIPPSHSLIPDYFTRAQRPRAVALFFLGGNLGFMLGYFAAGWLNEFHGWRTTFVMIGLPGLALAALACFSLKEPRRETPAAQAPVEQPSLKEVAAALWANQTFRRLLFAFSLVAFFGYGILQFQPTFFIRSHGLATGELGTWLAVLYGAGGLIGAYAGGALASRYAAYDERLQLMVIAAGYVSFAVIHAGVFLVSDRYVAFGLLGLVTLGAAAIMGPLFATIQTVVPARMRAMSIAVIYLFANLIGLGLGPLAAGALSDAFRPLLGHESLRYALVALCPGYLLASWHLWRASRTVMTDLAAVEEPLAVNRAG